MKRKIDEELYKIDLQKFKEQLTPNCLKVCEIEGDGNCMFRAIADQLEGDERRHFDYRVAACNYIKTNKDMYVPFIDEDETIEQYCNDMMQDAVWGGQMEMNALAHCY